jgi:hypothetical protein
MANQMAVANRLHRSGAIDFNVRHLALSTRTIEPTVSLIVFS